MGCSMNKSIIALILLLAPLAPALAASSSDLKDTAPDRYTVVEGDTLWGISGRYLKEPWRWPELWKMNQEQIRNPHRIYPGDVLVLDRSGHEARLRMANVPSEKLAPRIRAEALAPKAVSSISPAVIGPFLSKPLVVSQGELDSAARIIATQENRVAVSVGDVAYAEGMAKNKNEIWQIFRRGDALVDPETKETLGYEAIYLGEARARKHDGDVTTIEITKSAQEIYQNDRLLPARELPTFAYVPHAPQKSVKGRIISAYGNLQETGPNSIVALSRGSKDGLEVGHVLAIYRSQSSSRYTQRTAPLYGRSGITGNDEPRTYYGGQITPRDAPLYARGAPISESDLAKLPDERYGLIMVFRTFDRAAYGLVMQASRPVAVHDIVANP
jgi:hypothetical protein